jgi:hypothetical protein
MANLSWNGDDFRNEQDSSGATAGLVSRAGKLQQGYNHGSLTQGLVAYYPMDAGSGSTLEDKTELGNNGALKLGSSGATTTSGMWSSDAKIGDNCLSFDGQDDYVDLGDIPSSSSLQLSNTPSSFSAWFYQKSGGDEWQRIIDKSNGGNGKNGYALFLNPENQNIWLTVDQNEYKTVSGVYNFDEWNHVVGVVESSNFRIFLNGEEVNGSWDGSPQLPPRKETDMKIGSWNKNLTDNTRFWDGRLDEIRVYNRVLSTPEIQALYNLNSPSKVSPADTLH